MQVYVKFSVARYPTNKGTSLLDLTGNTVYGVQWSRIAA